MLSPAQTERLRDEAAKRAARRLRAHWRWRVGVAVTCSAGADFVWRLRGAWGPLALTQGHRSAAGARPNEFGPYALQCEHADCQRTSHASTPTGANASALPWAAALAPTPSGAYETPESHHQVANQPSSRNPPLRAPTQLQRSRRAPSGWWGARPGESKRSRTWPRTPPPRGGSRSSCRRPTLRRT